MESQSIIPGSVTGSSCCVSPGRPWLKSKVSSYLFSLKKNSGSLSALCLLPDPGRFAAFVSPGARRSVSRTRHWRHPRHNNGFKGHMQQEESINAETPTPTLLLLLLSLPLCLSVCRAGFISPLSLPLMHVVASWLHWYMFVCVCVVMVGCVHHGYQWGVLGWSNNSIWRMLMQVCVVLSR